MFSRISSVARALRLAACTIAVTFLSFTSHAQETKPAVAGVWYDANKDGAIRLFQCGPNLCGQIFWIKNPFQKSGAPLVDGNNPNASKRKRPICGLQIIGSLKKKSASFWVDGWIYDPKVGKEYNVQLTLASQNVLQVRGYLAFPALGETRVWRRAPDSLPKCADGQRDAEAGSASSG